MFNLSLIPQDIKDQLTDDKKEELLDKLRDLINDKTEAEEQYSLSDDSPCAEYASWGFTEGEGLRLIDLDDVTKLNVENIIKLRGQEFFVYNFTSVDLRGIEFDEFEVYSVNIGEIEFEVCPDIAEIIDFLELTDDQVNDLKINAYYKRSYLYTNLDYDRFCLLVDRSLSDKELTKKEINDL